MVAAAPQNAPMDSLGGSVRVRFLGFGVREPGRERARLAPGAGRNSPVLRTAGSTSCVIQSWDGRAAGLSKRRMRRKRSGTEITRARCGPPADYRCLRSANATIRIVARRRLHRVSPNPLPITAAFIVSLPRSIALAVAPAAAASEGTSPSVATEACRIV